VRPIRLTRAQQQAATRDRLLDAAQRVIDRHGFAGASIDLITAEAGYSKGAVYSNFSSKDAIFLELLRLAMERETAELERIVSLDADQLQGAMTAWLETLHAQSDCPLLWTELQLQARRNPAFAERYYALQDQQIRTLARILQRYFEVAGARLPMEPFDLAAALAALAHGITLQNPPRTSGTPSRAGRIVDDILKLLCRR
jgi:AcrR family transcriptional regulator